MLTQGGSDGQGQDKDGCRKRYSKGGWVSASAFFVVFSASYSSLCLFLVIFRYLSVQHEQIGVLWREGPTSRAPGAKVVKGSDTGLTDPHFDYRKVEEENRKQNNLSHQTTILYVLEEYTLEPNKIQTWIPHQAALLSVLEEYTLEPKTIPKLDPPRLRDSDLEKMRCLTQSHLWRGMY